MASDEFFEAFSSGVGCMVADCDCCGRTHFATGTHTLGQYERGELENYRSLAKASPDKFIEDGSVDGFSLVNVGVEAVWGCKCERLDAYERFVWNRRDAIVKYLKARIAEEKKRADKDGELLGGLG